MHVLLVESSERSYGGNKQYSIKPSNSEDTTILMVGVASKRSCVNTCHKLGWIIDGIVAYPR